jgi:hypothetical protein
MQSNLNFITNRISFTPAAKEDDFHLQKSAEKVQNSRRSFRNDLKIAPAIPVSTQPRIASKSTQGLVDLGRRGLASLVFFDVKELN